MEATGWRAHSVRGAMSGALKKKLGLTIVSEVVEGRGRVYRIQCAVAVGALASGEAVATGEAAAAATAPGEVAE